MKPRTLVSGGTGFVGRFIVERLIGADHEITVMGRSAPAPDFFTQPVRFVKGALDPDRDHRPAFENIDNFVHAAFDHLPGRYRGGEGADPTGFRRRNLDGTTALFETARERGVKRAVFLSSRAVYGDRLTAQTLTEQLPPSPDTLYGEVKLAVERHLDRLIAGGWRGASLRITGVYGPAGPGREHKWSDLISSYLAGGLIEPRAGTEVHGQDVAEAVLLMLTPGYDRHGKAAGSSAYNVSDVAVDRRDVLAIVKDVRGCKYPLPEAADRSTLNAMPTDRLRALGWKPGGWPQFERTVREMAARAKP